VAKSKVRQLFQDISPWPVVSSGLIAYLDAYCVFFLYPVFLNSEHMMEFPEYVPAIAPIGVIWRYCQML